MQSVGGFPQARARRRLQFYRHSRRHVPAITPRYVRLTTPLSPLCVSGRGPYLQPPATLHLGVFCVWDAKDKLLGWTAGKMDYLSGVQVRERVGWLANVGADGVCWIVCVYLQFFWLQQQQQSLTIKFYRREMVWVPRSLAVQGSVNKRIE